MSSSTTVIDRLAAKVDAFFVRVQERHGDQMRCAAGCDLCCRTRLSVTRAEAAAVTGAVRAMAPDEREKLRASIGRAADDRCAALDDDGRCGIYAARPIVCRSHGVPVRLDGIVDACRLNFTARGPAAADPDCILDQTTLSATLLAINGGDDTRTPLADVIRDALS